MSQPAGRFTRGDRCSKRGAGGSAAPAVPAAPAAPAAPASVKLIVRNLPYDFTQVQLVELLAAAPRGGIGVELMDADDPSAQAERLAGHSRCVRLLQFRGGKAPNRLKGRDAIPAWAILAAPTKAIAESAAAVFDTKPYAAIAPDSADSAPPSAPPTASSQAPVKQSSLRAALTGGDAPGAVPVLSVPLRLGLVSVEYAPLQRCPPTAAPAPGAASAPAPAPTSTSIYTDPEFIAFCTALERREASRGLRNADADVAVDGDAKEKEGDGDGDGAAATAPPPLDALQQWLASTRAREAARGSTNLVRLLVGNWYEGKRFPWELSAAEAAPKLAQRGKGRRAGDAADRRKSLRSDGAKEAVKRHSRNEGDTTVRARAGDERKGTGAKKKKILKPKADPDADAVQKKGAGDGRVVRGARGPKRGSRSSTRTRENPAGKDEATGATTKRPRNKKAASPKGSPRVGRGQSGQSKRSIESGETDTRQRRPRGRNAKESAEAMDGSNAGEARRRRPADDAPKRPLQPKTAGQRRQKQHHDPGTAPTPPPPVATAPTSASSPKILMRRPMPISGGD